MTEMAKSFLAHVPDRFALVGLSMGGMFGDIDVPTLMLCGDQDRLCPPKSHEKLHARIKGSTFEKIENAGYLQTPEQPKATTAALETGLQAPN